MRHVKTSGYVLWALLFISTVPYNAEAGTVRIYPDQFKPVNPSNPDNAQMPVALYGGSGPAQYCAIAKLPVGKSVKRLVAFHSSNVGTSRSSVRLLRSRFGPCEQPSQDLAEVECSGFTGGPVIALHRADISYAEVRAGFRYWVLVDLAPGNNLHGVKVKYE